MTWELDISRDKGESWSTELKAPTAEACKVAALALHTSGAPGTAGLWFRIYAQGGSQLMWGSLDNRPGHLSWLAANGMPRAAQHGEAVAA